MADRLSSHWTFFYRSVFPVAWIGGFGLGTLAMWLGGMDTPEPAPQEMKWFFLLGWIVGSSFIIWFARRLRDVSLRGGFLVIGNFGEAVSIPLHLVETVTETRLWNPKMINVRLQPRADTPDQIVFLAPWAFQLPFTDHPVVRRLRAQVQEARTASEARNHVQTPFSRA